MKTPDLSPTTMLILAGAAVVGIILWRQSDNIANGVATVYEDARAIGVGTVDLAGGLLTGNNTITQGARTDAYQGWGVIGTLGAATDRILGGAPSRVGETLGGWLYDLTN